MVKDMLFAPILYGHEHLTSHLLLLEDSLFGFVQVLFAVFCVMRFWKYIGWFHWLDADSFLFIQDGYLGHMFRHGVEGDCVCIPLEQSISPSGVGSFESIRCLEESTFVGSSGEDNPFDERKGLAAG